MHTSTLPWLIALVLLSSGYKASGQALRVGPDQRHLVDPQGKPFFYLGDTAWELFGRLTREEVHMYLHNRAAKGFTVIEAPVLPVLGRLQAPNRYGQVPLHNLDPLQPNEAYFEHVDYVIDAANALGLYFALAPTWGDKVSMTRWSGSGPEIFNPDNARRYGEWIGKRYRDKRIIWMLGGDRNPEKEEHLTIWRAMAAGVEAGAGPDCLVTFHPEGEGNSAQYFHQDRWLDFNMIQSGHSRKGFPNDSMIRINYELIPTKPTLDGEPRYEEGSDQTDALFDAADVRQAAYGALLAGACGHVYGNHNVWQFWQPGREAISHAHTPWQKALDHPGAFQMGYLRKLFEQIGWEQLLPGQNLLLSGKALGISHQLAAVAADQHLLVAYSPLGEPIKINPSAFAVKQTTARWFDPRNGAFLPQPAKPVQGAYVPPTRGRGSDWILLLERTNASTRD